MQTQSSPVIKPSSFFRILLMSASRTVSLSASPATELDFSSNRYYLATSGLIRILNFGFSSFLPGDDPVSTGCMDGMGCRPRLR